MVNCVADTKYDGKPQNRADDIKILKANLKCRLSMKDPLPDKPFKPISLAFPPCSDLFLLQVKKIEPIDQDIVELFKEYFTFEKHKIFDNDNIWNPELKCLSKEQQDPSPWCLPPSCVTLEGKRGITEQNPEEKPIIKRLFVGDLVWLFYFERMGIFKILGVILDDYATKGKIPISNNGLTAVILDAMVRQTKMGLSSTLRDRDSTYRRSLGWTSDAGRKLGSEAQVNTAFTNLFHKFIQLALEYYKDKRLAAAIQKTTEGKPSVATLISIGDTIHVLKDAFKPFNYGRNYSITLGGIVWIVAAMDLINKMKTTLGIPDTLKQAYEYISAAYDLLLMGKPTTSSEINRYKIHLECAKDARDILLDLEVMGYEDKMELEIWLDHVESRIEGYRTAYRSLTGVDLGASGTPTIEQAV